MLTLRYMPNTSSVLHLHPTLVHLLFVQSLYSPSKDLFRRAGTKNIEVPNIIHWCGARQLALFLTLEHYKNMLAAGKKRGGDK